MGDTVRGRTVAALLSGAWRDDPGPLSLTAGEVRPLVGLLLATGSAGLAWWRLSRAGHLEDAAFVPLREAYRAVSVQAILHEQRVRSIVALVRAAGVEPLIGKGLAVARLYPRPGLRPYGDVDLYVAAEDYARAGAALRGPGGETADLHRGFAELDDRDAGERGQRAERLVVGGTEVHVLGPEDHLRLLALHMLRHGMVRPVWLCDVALALEARPPSFDWDYFAAGDRRRTEWAMAALRAAGEILGARLEGVPAAVANHPLPGWLVETVHVEWSRARTPHGARTPMVETLRRGRGLARALRQRWPNGIEATVGVGGAFDGRPRLVFQVANAAARSGRFLVRLGFRP